MARIGVAALVVALVGAGLVAVQGFGSSGGSATPEQAVEDLLGAVGNEDFIGAAELVEPSERRTLVEPAIDMVGELKRLRVLADDFDLRAVSGVDYEFTDMTYTPDILGPGVTRVGVDGTATATGDVRELRLGALVLDNVPADALQEMQDEAAVASTDALDDVGIVAVERGGRWYVSLWYSVAELARRDSGGSAPRFGQGPTPIGGGSPEEAVRAMATHAVDLNLGGVIAMLDPEEMAALYDYSTLFLDEADAAAADFRAETPDFVATIDRLDLRSEIDGDDAEVWIDSVAFSIRGGGEGVTVDTAADCILFSYDEWTPEGECLFDRSAVGGEDLWGIVLDIEDVPSPSVRLHRVDGRWYLSPTASLVQPMLEFLRAVDADQLQRWIDDPDLLVEESPELLVSTPAVAGVAVLGVAAVFLLGQSIDQQFTDVTESTGSGFADPPAAATELFAERETRAVYVVTTEMTAGTSVDAGSAFAMREIPVAFVPAGAIVDLGPISGQVAAYDIYPGEILVAGMFVDPTDLADRPTTTAPAPSLGAP